MHTVQSINQENLDIVFAMHRFSYSAEQFITLFSHSSQQGLRLYSTAPVVELIVKTITTTNNGTVHWTIWANVELTVNREMERERDRQCTKRRNWEILIEATKQQTEPYSTEGSVDSNLFQKEKCDRGPAPHECEKQFGVAFSWLRRKNFEVG